MTSKALSQVFGIHFHSESPSAAVEAPLLSRAGREFLNGKIDAEAYVAAGRREARQRAYHEFAGRSKRIRRFAAIYSATNFIVYSVIAVGAFIGGHQGGFAVVAA